MRPREFCIRSLKFCLYNRELLLQKLRFTLVMLCTSILCNLVAAAPGPLSGL